MSLCGSELCRQPFVLLTPLRIFSLRSWCVTDSRGAIGIKLMNGFIFTGKLVQIHFAIQIGHKLP